MNSVRQKLTTHLLTVALIAWLTGLSFLPATIVTHWDQATRTLANDESEFRTMKTSIKLTHST